MNHELVQGIVIMQHFAWNGTAGAIAEMAIRHCDCKIHGIVAVTANDDPAHQEKSVYSTPTRRRTESFNAKTVL